jgi:hypothetical protein
MGRLDAVDQAKPLCIIIKEIMNIKQEFSSFVSIHSLYPTHMVQNLTNAVSARLSQNVMSTHIF